MMTSRELRQAYNMFADAWKLFKRLADVSGTGEYWKAVAGEGDQIAKRYGNSKLVCALLLVVVDELERQAKEVRSNAKTQPGI